ncbi:hypothetical protein CSU32_04045 [Salmonella enterica subsp. diarizonae]|uniref:Uncharacterized protein n=1 Tax=Salmonella diarizonae TaxID=59204 RepID=A0A6Y1ULV3_SALDZ|nr:hypothetical protein [Salmonella enterica subsp. diarizonae]ECI3358642.1 hypothetical protein [Salmonella enterica subsp. diarizonae]HAB4051958.1 hypothetical protein [Salmonella enterica subsp. diarizonae]
MSISGFLHSHWIGKPILNWSALHLAVVFIRVRRINRRGSCAALQNGSDGAAYAALLLRSDGYARE